MNHFSCASTNANIFILWPHESPLVAIALYWHRKGWNIFYNLNLAISRVHYQRGHTFVYDCLTNFSSLSSVFCAEELKLSSKWPNSFLQITWYLKKIQMLLPLIWQFLNLSTYRVTGKSCEFSSSSKCNLYAWSRPCFNIHHRMSLF